MIYFHYILMGFCVAVGVVLGGGFMGAILALFKQKPPEITTTAGEAFKQGLAMGSPTEQQPKTIFKGTKQSDIKH